ncbi:MAG: lysophospholipid acyltransferase family protein [Ardenticatenaceae bacterium]|nr:lysophospholipid acyltransferase family protein [Ardenticatenaceae bacterium]
MTQPPATPQDETSFPTVGEALPRRGTPFTQKAARTILTRLGWRLEGDIVNLPKMVLIGAPHTSNWDLILTIGAIFALGLHVSWVAKHTIFRWPLGVLLRWLGGIGINRKSTKGFVEKMAMEIQARDKILLAIMPEGTRSKVREWRSGFYYIAHQAQVPIYPVIFDYGRKILGFGPAIYTTGDFEADLPRIKSYFAHAIGYNPTQSGS